MRTWLESIRQDVRFGVRLCRKDATVTLAAVLSLSLAIGACTAAFTLINALVLRPLPVQNPERLVYVSNRAPEGDDQEYFSYPMFEHLREASREQLRLFAMAYQAREEIAFDGTDAQAEWAYPHAISGEALELLGVKPSLGRLLTASDGRAGRPPVAVLSHDFWTRRFARDPAVLGRWMRYRGTHLQIVGVAEGSFRGVEPGLMTDVWVPITSVRADQVSNPNSTWLRIWGRLQPGVGAGRARAVLQAASIGFLQDRAVMERLVPPQVDLLSAGNGPSSVRKRFHRPLLILGTAALVVLLIACANVASLLIARTDARSREMGLRVALGAGRRRLVQQVLTESGLLSVASCALGALFAAFVSPAVVGLMSTSQAPLRLDLALDWRVLVFVGFACSLTTVLFGLMPALRAAASAPGDSLKTAGRHTATDNVFRPLLAGQIAFGFLVLFVGGLLVTSFSRLVRIDPGFAAGDLAIVNVDANGLQQNPTAALAVWQRLVDRLNESAGVEAASVSEFALFEGPQAQIDVRLPDGGESPIRFHHLRISPGFLQTMRIALRDGRDFTWRDARSDAAPVVIVNESFARRFFPGEPAVGKRLSTRQGGRLEIVGVAQDARYRSLREPPPPTVYSPNIARRYASLQIRTRLDVSALGSRLRDELMRAHPALRMMNLTQQSTLVGDTLVQERMLALLAAFFSAAAGALVAVGVYGVIGYNVAQRRREFGIRLAIGATPRSIAGLVARDVSVVLGIGLVVGVAGAQAAAGLIASLLYDVRASDASSIALPIASLLAVCALSAAQPALWATRVDPAATLRRD